MTVANPAGTHEVLVEDVRSETPSVKTFRLRFPSGTGFDFLPGQFVMLYFPDNPKRGRAYSIASSPLEQGVVEISLNRVGAFTARLFDLKANERLLLKGPYGKWVYTDDVPHAVLISGGTGVTPFRCIARYVVQKKLPNRLTILSSSRTPSDILYRAEFDGYARFPNIRVVHTITRPRLMGPDERWDGLTGRINLDKIVAVVPDFEQAHYYMCGPNQLIDSLSAALAAKGIPRERIRYEKWGEFSPRSED